MCDTTIENSTAVQATTKAVQSAANSDNSVVSAGAGAVAGAAATGAVAYAIHKHKKK